MKKVKFSNGLSGKGFTAALVLSICAVGISTYAAYNGAVSRLTDSGTVSHDDNVIVFGDENFSAVDVGAEKLDVPKTTTAAVTAPETSAADEAGFFFGSPKTMPIADAEVLNAYSGGELVKSETLGVWKTHDGVDLAAEVGTAVCAMMKGTVSEIKNDPLWGVCVVIDHGDNVVGHYCNLSENLNVKTGQAVAMGEIIGQVGATADIECKTAPHLHFGVTQNNAWVDPIKFIEK